MSAMRDMSRAIRHELQDLGISMRDIGDQDLREITEIVGAYFYDLVAEQDRRGWGSPRPAAAVARHIQRLKDCLEAHHRMALTSEETCIVCEGVDATLDSDPGGITGLGADGDGPGHVAGEDAQ